MICSQAGEDLSCCSEGQTLLTPGAGKKIFLSEEKRELHLKKRYQPETIQGRLTLKACFIHTVLNFVQI